MIDELRHFLLVAEHGTLTAAARRAHLSQPALTASMHRLEAHFGAALLDRDRSGARVTAAGQALLPRARAALAAIEAGAREVREVMGLERGEVRLGAGAIACTYLLPPVLARFRKRHPGIRFRLQETTPEEALERLDGGALDIALISHPDVEPWFDDDLVLVGAPRLEVEAVDDAPFVTFRPGASSRLLLERTFPNVNVVMELGSVATVKGMVRAGLGLALVSRVAVADMLARGWLVEVEDPRTPVMRQLGLLHRGRLPPAAAAFREMMLKHPPA